LNKIDLEEVAKKYNFIPEIWIKDDKWHLKTHKMIYNFIWDFTNKVDNFNNMKVLNAGSAGYSYGLKEDNIIHIDIAKNKILNLKNSVYGNIENTNFDDNQFDLIICVGSVINYCDPIKVIGEFKRILHPRGWIILEYESSFTFELIGKTDFNKKATLIETFYNKSKEIIWYYSESFMKDIINSFKLEITRKKNCHILSPLIFRMFRKENFASYFCFFDLFLSYVPLLNKFSSNNIYLIKDNS
jgi:SAM-dependent methyltransferase